jgi:hypothetical protein
MNYNQATFTSFSYQEAYKMCYEFLLAKKPISYRTISNYSKLDSFLERQAYTVEIFYW